MRKIKALAAAFGLTLAASQASAAIVDLDGTANASTDGSNAVSLALGAGTYKVTFVSGAYEAFNRFGLSDGCDGANMSCSRGWENSAKYVVGANTFSFGDRGANGGLGAMGPTYYGTSAMSFAAAGAYSAVFTLAAADTVDFYIFDDFLGDNVGGVSLSVAAVPEPATWATMIGGLGLAGFALRRRRALAAA